MADLEIDDDRPLSPADLEVWSRLVEALAPVLPDAEPCVGDGSRALDDDATGISLLYATDEVSVSVPIDHRPGAPAEIIDLVTRVVTVVEAETGLVAYDPLADQPFLPARRSSGGGGSDQVRHLFGDPGVGQDRPPR